MKKFFKYITGILREFVVRILQKFSLRFLLEFRLGLLQDFFSEIFITIPSYMSQRIYKGILPVVSPKMFFEISLDTLEIRGLLRKFCGL